jgi:hypothetical protein
LIYQEGLSLYIQTQTARATIEKANADAIAARSEAERARAAMRPIGERRKLDCSVFANDPDSPQACKELSKGN